VCGSRSHTKHAVNTYRLRTSIRNIYNSAHDVGIAVANAAISLWYKCVYALANKALKIGCKDSVRRHMVCSSSN
jgi:hypothetical protein